MGGLGGKALHGVGDMGGKVVGMGGKAVHGVGSMGGKVVGIGLTLNGPGLQILFPGTGIRMSCAARVFIKSSWL